MPRGKRKGVLFEGTLDLHHAVERTFFGQRLSRGEVNPREYLYWITQKRPFLMAVSRRYPDGVTNIHRWRADIEALEVRLGTRAQLHPKVVEVARSMGEDVPEDDLDGVAYVLLGAAIMGGKIIRSRMPPDIPSSQYVFADRAVALDALDALRDNGAALPAARATFGALLAAAKELSQCRISPA